MKKKLIAITAVLGIAVGAVFICRCIEPKNPQPPLTLNEYQREAYLNIRGWEAEEISCETVRIPEEFEGIYKEYTDIQSKDNFNLEDYKGKEVMRCLYKVLNYGGDSEVTAELLLYNDELISAALIENKPDGFIKSLNSYFFEAGHN